MIRPRNAYGRRFHDWIVGWRHPKTRAPFRTLQEVADAIEFSLHFVRIVRRGDHVPSGHARDKLDAIIDGRMAPPGLNGV